MSSKLGKYKNVNQIQKFPKENHRTSMYSSKYSRPKSFQFIEISVSNKSLEKNKRFFALKSPKNKFKKMQLKVIRAIEEKKIFTVIGGSQFDLLRFLLKSRGWIEKIVNDGKKNKTKFNVESAMVQDYPSYFVWLPRNHDDIEVRTEKSSWISRIPKHPTYDFTRKDGLKRCQDEVQWHYLKGISDLNSPRTFTLHDQLGRQEFEQEFKFTSAMSFLTFLNFHKDFPSLFSERGSISNDLIDCALLQINLMLKVKRHEDIDFSSCNCSKCSQWFNAKLFKNFQEQAENVMKNGKLFKWQTNFSMEELKKKFQRTLLEVYHYWPQRVYDGYRNIWVLKPYEASCGKGICLMDNYQEILDLVADENYNFIAQKYIGEV